MKNLHNNAYSTHAMTTSLYTKFYIHTAIIKWKNSINNLLKATELTIWMVSILHSSALLNHFRRLTTSIISFSMFLSWLLSVWLGTLHFGAPGSAGEENLGITSRDCDSSASFWVLASSPRPPRHVPRSLFINGTAELSRFLHLVLVRTDLELCWEGGAVAPLQLPRLPGSTSLSSECTGARMDGGSRRGGGQEERVESRQWDSGITLLWPTSFRSALNASI